MIALTEVSPAAVVFGSRQKRAHGRVLPTVLTQKTPPAIDTVRSRHQPCARRGADGNRGQTSITRAFDGEILERVRAVCRVCGRDHTDASRRPRPAGQRIALNARARGRQDPHAQLSYCIPREDSVVQEPCVAVGSVAIECSRSPPPSECQTNQSTRIKISSGNAHCIVIELHPFNEMVSHY